MSKGFSKILTLVIALLLLAGGFVVYLSLGEPEQKQEQEQDETLDWQTYRNEEWGFEIQYPGNLEVREDLDYDGYVREYILGSVTFEEQNHCLSG